jgi:hypothetical protein
VLVVAAVHAPVDGSQAPALVQGPAVPGQTLAVPAHGAARLAGVALGAGLAVVAAPAGDDGAGAVPLAPWAAVQAWQAPKQAVSQQTPATHTPLWQVEPELHAAPSGAPTAAARKESE